MIVGIISQGEQVERTLILLLEFVGPFAFVRENSARQRGAPLPRDQAGTFAWPAREQQVDVLFGTREPREILLQEASEDVLPEQRAHGQARLREWRLW